MLFASSNYHHKNRLYQAFYALGCVIRTVFLLTMISDVKLREVKFTEQPIKWNNTMLLRIGYDLRKAGLCMSMPLKNRKNK